MNKSFLIVIALASTMASCTINKDVPDNVVPGEILIDLKEDVKPTIIETTFQKYGLKQEKVVSPSLNIILYKYNAEKIALEKLIKKVKKEESVENAQSNKRTTNRG